MLGPSTPRILIVDDEPAFADYVARVASEVGYVVRVETDSTHFKAVFEQVAPHVLVLDIVMPNTDGIELIQWLATREYTVKVFLVSGYSPNYIESARMLAKAKGLQCLVALNKPVRLAELRPLLQSAYSDAAIAAGPVETQSPG